MPVLAVTQIEARKRQEELGQFLTPEPIAKFMASLFGPLPSSVRLLDAGAGDGALTAAFISRICRNNDGVRSIKATLFEIDPNIHEALARNMHDCERACAEVKISLRYEIHDVDFIQEMTSRLEDTFFSERPPQFDAAIVNPPYRKIASDSPERRFLSNVGIETVNLYSGFIALIQRLLASTGQLVAITPRSFCNGPYFRSFRRDLLDNFQFQQIHIFESRVAAFRKDSVLQENIIFHAIKGGRQPRNLKISCSSGEAGDDIVEQLVPFTEVVHPRDAEKFIHIPSGQSHAAAKQVMDRLTTSLGSLGLSVSTGPVVDFRLKDALRMQPETGTVPLLYPCHFKSGVVQWPILDSRKPNAIVENDETRRWLLPSGTYLLTKRFTSKEERRRVVASILNPDALDVQLIGIENHLNYFHNNGRGLERDLAFGLFAFLNSTVVDQYFRRFSGHTQVNATDLRKLPYPDRKTLQAVGAEMRRLDLTQEEIDELWQKHLNAY